MPYPVGTGTEAHRRDDFGVGSIERETRDKQMTDQHEPIGLSARDDVLMPRGRHKTDDLPLIFRIAQLEVQLAKMTESAEFYREEFEALRRMSRRGHE